MTKYISTAETAKLVRKALKDAFKGIKFSVRSHVYAGGSSIDVCYVDGPSSAAVEAVVKDFAGSSFDGMTDLQTSVFHELNGETVRFGSDYVFVRQEISDARLSATDAALRKMAQDDIDYLAFKVRADPYGNSKFVPDSSDWRGLVYSVAKATLAA